MTYNQVLNELQTICEGHAMVKSVKNETPVEWINRNSIPDFPCVNYSINSGSYGLGREVTYRIDLWILDKSGNDGEFESEVISDTHKIGGDIVHNMMQQFKSYSIGNVNWIALSEKFEDYLSGVKLTIDLSAMAQYGACDIPVL